MIVNKLGNSRVTQEIKYADIRYDNKGRPFFIDTGVHESLQIAVVDHREKNEHS